MIVTEKVTEIRELLGMMPGNESVGFVPTMGALHAGHISLVNQAKADNQIVVSSIFVNPTQFNDKDDLDRYPRTPEADQILLSDAGCDVLFAPPVAEVYPTDALLDMDFGDLERVMEGAFRPGHFKGVATVVARLFDIVRPRRAYFGEKDFQQLAIIRAMNDRLHKGVEIIGCPTLREPDGLAMSSRNRHLTGPERASAAVIYKTLQWVASMKHQMPPGAVRSRAVEMINREAGFRVQYLEVVDAATLQPVDEWLEGRPLRVCVAVLTSGTRLIDNLAL